MSYRLFCFFLLLAIFFMTFGSEFIQNSAFDQIDEPAEFMIKNVLFISDIAYTAKDIFFLLSKVIGVCLVFVGIKNATKCHWIKSISSLIFLGKKFTNKKLPYKESRLN